MPIEMARSGAGALYVGPGWKDLAAATEVSLAQFATEQA